MGSGGVIAIKWCEKKKCTGPAQSSLSSTSSTNVQKNARHVQLLLTLDSWTFKQNSQHEKFRALRDEFKDIKNLT